MVLGILLSPFVGTFETMSDVMIHRFGPVVGGLASALSLTGSMLWAGVLMEGLAVWFAPNVDFLENEQTHEFKTQKMEGVQSSRYGVEWLVALDMFFGSCDLPILKRLLSGAQYKAILSLAASLNLFPSEFLEASVALGLLLWFVAGGLMADIWLDALSMLIVAPTMILLAYVAVNETPHAAWEAEQVGEHRPVGADITK